MLRGQIHLLLIMGMVLGVTSAAEQVAPVEQRVNELLAALRAEDDLALRQLVETGMHPDFRSMGSMEEHLQHMGRMRETLGTFTVEDIRIAGPDRGDFVLRSGEGDLLALHVETESIVPFRFMGIGLSPFNPDQDIPQYTSLEQAEHHLVSLEEKNLFSGVVLVARQGSPIFTRAYGMANKAKAIRNTMETSFDVGSITKAHTAVAVMQLVESGRVDLEAPMSRYLQGFTAAIADRVRVVDLLRMESGYGDYFTAEFEARRLELRTISDYLEMFRTYQLEFEPGTQELYSNVGYVILGGIIEAVTGVTYHDYIREHVFKPAGMTSSYFRDIDKRDPLRAVGYTNEGPTGEGYTHPNLDILEVLATPSGGSFSSADDLLRFNQALWGNQLLSEEYSTQVLNGFNEGAPRPRMRAVAGGAPGVSAVSLEDVDSGVSVIVLSNYDEPLAEHVGMALFKLVRDEPVADRQGAVASMKIIDHQPAVEVLINGKGPFLFLLDTGAAGSGQISRELAQQFRMKKVGEIVAGDPSGRNVETRDVVGVGELSLAGHTWQDVEMELPGPGPAERGIDGILGFALFEGILLTLDYPAGELRLASGELPPVDGYEIVTFRARHGIPMIDLDVAGTIVPADIDSGSMGWLMVPESVAARLPLAGEPQVIGRASTAFNEFDISSATLDGVLRIGGHQFDHPQVHFAGIFPHGNVGGEFLSQFKVTFDQVNGRLRLASGPEGSLGQQPRYRVGVMLAQDQDGRLTVDSTLPDSPARRAGLLKGDRILRINGQAIEDLSPAESTRAFGRGDEILLVIARDGAELELTMTPEMMK